VKRTDPCLGSDRRSLNNPRNKLESTDSRVLEETAKSQSSRKRTPSQCITKSRWKAMTRERSTYCLEIAVARPRNKYFCILPVAVFGSSLTNETRLGALK
jgi:hypothetical protein